MKDLSGFIKDMLPRVLIQNVLKDVFALTNGSSEESVNILN